MREFLEFIIRQLVEYPDEARALAARARQHALTCTWKASGDAIESGLVKILSGEPQWLSLPDQESPANGYRPTAIISGATPGKLAISVSDLGYTSAESGATADSGFLASFNLQAIGEGTGTVTLEPFAGGSVLFDTSLSPAGVPQLLGEKKIKIKRSR